MENLNINITETKDFLDSKETTLQINKKNKKSINPKEIKRLTENLLQSAPKGSKLRIRGLGIDRWHTLKGYDTNLDVKEDEEYYDGKVRETGKFADFSQIEITILKLK